MFRVLPDEFLLKSTVMTTDFKRIFRAEREYMNIHPPINALVAALNVHTNILFALCLYFYLHLRFSPYEESPAVVLQVLVW